MQRHVLCRHPVHSPLGLAQKTQGPNRAFPHPRRERGLLHHGNELPDVPVRRMPVVARVQLARRRVGVAMVMMLGVIVDRDRRQLLVSARQDNVDLGRPHAATGNGRQFNRYLRATHSGGQLGQPLLWRASCHECAQEHVAADSCGRIENGKTSIGHRLINIAPAQPGGKSAGLR
jgi:hypothetical protein